MPDSELTPILDNQYVQNNVCSKAHLQNETITACVIALGSNCQASSNLRLARQALNELGSSNNWSSPFDNLDYTATVKNPKPNYTNQCGYLMFESSMTLQTLTQYSKRIESDCQRKTYHKNTNNAVDATSTVIKQVSVDIDILAVKTVGQWHIIEERYPFKEHEQIGLEELITLNKQ